MLGKIARLLLALIASLLLITPSDVFRLGLGGVITSIRLISFLYGLSLILWVAAQRQVLGEKYSPPLRTFDEAVFLAFVSTVPFAFVELTTAVAPSIGTAVGIPFAFGMSVALATRVRYATYDHPAVENRRYWRLVGLYPSLVFSLMTAAQVIRKGFSGQIASNGSLAVVSWPLGLWVGLNLGYRIKEWSAVWVQVLDVIRRLARPMLAFAFGYFSIVIVFASGYAAL